MIIRKFIFVLVLFIAFSGCKYIKDVVDEKSPREYYLESLQDAGLSETMLVKEWISAAETAVNNPVEVKLPYAEKGYFTANEPEAAGLKFNVQQGEKLILKINTDDSSSVVFIELYELNFDGRELEIYFGEKDSTIEYKPDEDKTLLVLMQPEVLKHGNYRLEIVKAPLLGFPVKGKNGNDIGSFWNDHRDGGKRLHKGVDIFASKGTPVLAADDGIVYRVANYGIGGKFIWLRTKDYSLYYAHLDSQYVSTGSLVKAGDILGTVGNTGNARFTAPHLHFGIYTMGGAVNPYPFVYDLYKKPLPITVSELAFGKRIKLDRKTLVYSLPGEKKSVAALAKSEEIKITGGSGGYYKIVADNNKGFIPAAAIQSYLR